MLIPVRVYYSLNDEQYQSWTGMSYYTSLIVDSPIYIRRDTSEVKTIDVIRDFLNDTDDFVVHQAFLESVVRYHEDDESFNEFFEQLCVAFAKNIFMEIGYPSLFDIWENPNFKHVSNDHFESLNMVVDEFTLNLVMYIVFNLQNNLEDIKQLIACCEYYKVSVNPEFDVLIIEIMR